MAQDLTTSTNPDGSFSFVANHQLGPKEGLTILLKFPKGYFAEPTSSQKLQYLLHDNRDAEILGAGGRPVARGKLRLCSGVLYAV